jgi:pimeloyl-ACP methyl ester carboxylesterase
MSCAAAGTAFGAEFATAFGAAVGTAVDPGCHHAVMRGRLSSRHSARAHVDPTRRQALIAMAASAGLSMAGCASVPPERLLQVGSSRIAHVQRGSVPPTAVFQAGLGDGLAVWAGVLDRVGRDDSVFAHDRPGYGRSPSTEGPRDACSIASELREALRAANLPPPYLLVGHSIGGLYQYAYAKLYPDEVAGLLLLDPTHPEHWATMQQRAPGAAAVVNTLRRTMFSGAMRREFDDQAVCLDRLRTLKPPAAPLRMLVRSRFELVELGAFQTLVRDLERRWQDLLPGLVRREVDGSGHYIQKDRPDIVAQELRALRQRPGSP